MEVHRPRGLAADIKSLSAEIRALKNCLRQTWTRPMQSEQRTLVQFKRLVTELCVLRAALRGRYHVLAPLRAGSYLGMRWDKDAYRNQVLERIAPAYQSSENAG